METLPDTLPDDPVALQTMILSMREIWAGERESWTGKLEALQRRADLLHEQVKLLLSRQYGRSSEKGFDHPSLFDEAEAEAAVHPAAEDGEEVEAADATVEVAGHARRTRGRRPLPEGLPREEILHDLPDAEKICGLDGHGLVEIGRETSEQLEVIPAQVKVIRHVRIKYGCPHCRAGVKLAPLPPQPLPKALATAATLAWVAVSKYVYGLPLYRLELQFARMGIELPRATPAHWMVKTGQLLQPLVNLARDWLLESGYIQMDETVVQVLKEPGKAATSKSYMAEGRSPGRAGDPLRLRPEPLGKSPERAADRLQGLVADRWL